MRVPRVEAFAVLFIALGVGAYLEFGHDGPHDGPHKLGLAVCVAFGLVLAWLVSREGVRD